MRTFCRILVAAAVLLAVSTTPAHATIITQLSGFGDFLGNVSASNDFESTVNVAGITFDATAYRDSACSWAGCVTPSGVWGLVEPEFNEPLRAVLGTDAYEVGMFWGNDDYGYTFNAILRVYDAGNTLLGSVIVAANRNDLADQFIGLRSDTAFRYVDFSFQRPEAQGLYDYIDDFKVSDYQPNSVPEPASSLALL